jgi:hypothetical protein
MGHESTLYGVIVSPRWKREDSERLQRHNQAVVLALPEHDTWPFLTRSMFAFAGTTVEGGRYRSQVIHFGVTLKAVEWEWDEWLAKFERLLTQLFWDDVYLHLRTEGTVGDYDYRYRAENSIERFYTQEPPLPADHWIFTGGPRGFAFAGPNLHDADVTSWVYQQGQWLPQRH